MKINMHVLIELTEMYSFFTLNSHLNELLSEEHKNVDDQQSKTFKFNCYLINFCPICHFVHKQNKNDFLTSLDKSVLGSWLNLYSSVESKTGSLLYSREVSIIRIYAKFSIYW